MRCILLFTFCLISFGISAESIKDLKKKQQKAKEKMNLPINCSMKRKKQKKQPFLHLALLKSKFQKEKISSMR
jgi:hypothetical protein